MTDSLNVYDECIQRIREGDETAREELFDLAYHQLVRLTRRMLRSFLTVKRWEQTDDVWQNAGIRLWKALETVELENARHFLNLAALQIRRQLVELARHYGGARGIARHHATPPEASTSGDGTPHYEQASGIHDPHELASWTSLHEGVDRLPDDERETFQLIWYQGLTQAEVAALVDVSLRTVKRRWQSARLHLSALLDEHDFEAE